MCPNVKPEINQHRSNGLTVLSWGFLFGFCCLGGFWLLFCVFHVFGLVWLVWLFFVVVLFLFGFGFGFVCLFLSF